MVKFIRTPSFKLAVYMLGDLKAKKLALVLPGRLDTKDYPHMRSHVNYLAKKGYLALSFDPPGTWESLGNIKLYTSTNYFKAVNELINYFGNKPTVIMGHSRGGSIAMLAGTQNKYITHIITAMSRPQPSKMSAQGKIRGFDISYRDTPTGGKRKFELPKHYFDDASKYNNMVDALSKCKKPKLYIYGTKDVDITPDNVMLTFNKSSKPKEIHAVNCDHDYRFHPSKIKEINSLIGKFLDKN